MDPKLTQNGKLKMNPKWTQNEPKLDTKCTKIGNVRDHAKKTQNGQNKPKKK